MFNVKVECGLAACHCKQVDVRSHILYSFYYGRQSVVLYGKNGHSENLLSYLVSYEMHSLKADNGHKSCSYGYRVHAGTAGKTDGCSHPETGRGCHTADRVLLEDYYNQQEKFEGISAKIALKITNSTLSFLQNGLDKKSASETVDIIIKDSETFDFVAITSMDEILGFTSYRTEAPFVTFLKNDFEKLFKSDFSIPTEKLDVIRACLTVPLYDDKRKFGYLCAGHIMDNRVSPMEETLINGIGTMISTQLAFHNIKEKADLLQQAEIKALQSQINPHFLFNALSTISYYCTQQPQTAKTLINDLANYYRKNLADADTMITIREELQHIGAYIHLEQARFRERLQVDYELNTENSFMLPALILQPLVENAIKHGLYPKITGGKITIRIDEKPSYFRITVIDDGMGIAREKLATILDDSVPKKSIGLSNVNKRLNTLYGSKNRLRIFSRINKGTIVSMRIPVQEVISTQ